jgi:hypothetical protein
MASPPSWSVETALAACLAAPETAARLQALSPAKRAYVTNFDRFAHIKEVFQIKARGFRTRRTYDARC